MIHEMDIWHESFVKIKEQTKTIEMRLFDEKRSLISIGDTIIFTDTSNKEKIDCMVINMYRYLSFEELYQHHSKVSIGYNKDEIANPKEMLMYYSKEMIEQYGVVAIEIKVLQLPVYRFFSPDSLIRTTAIIVGIIMIGIGWYKKSKSDKKAVQYIKEHD